jgi:hypothetical protein
MKFIRQSTHDI